MKTASAILKASYQRKKRVNKGFTLRVLAGKLNVSIPFVSHLLTGRRNIPLAKVDLLCDLLDLDSERRSVVLKAAIRDRSRLLKENKGGLPGEAEEEAPAKNLPWVYQPAKAFWVLENPVYLDILNVTLLKNFDGSAAAVARRLGIPENEAEAALARLLNAGFLTREKDKLRKTSRYNDFNSSANKDQIQKYHQNALTRAIRQIQAPGASVEDRLITTCVVTMPRQKLNWVKGKLRKLIEDISTELPELDGDDVYQLSLQLFPVTRPEN